MVESPVAELEDVSEVNGATDIGSAVKSNGQAAVVEVVGPTCEKCQTPHTGKQEWCRRCGWHPRMRIHCELDPWDRENQLQPKADTNSKLEIFRRLIPLWAWKLMAGVAVIVAASIVARMMLPRGGSLRFIWTIAQMVSGELVLMAGHLAAYLFAIMENDRLTFLDIILKPVAIWAPVFHSLPSTFWRVALGTWGMTIMLCGFIVGGLADKDLMDWGGKPAHVNLMSAITEQAQKMAGEAGGSLEDSIQDFAGKAAVKQPENSPPAKPKLMLDCLIIGYEPDGEHDFHSLILASAVDGKLACVGSVSSGISAEVRAELNRRMPTLLRAEPFVPNRFTGIWLRPTLACRVSAKEWSANKKLMQANFEEMLSDIPLGQ